MLWKVKMLKIYNFLPYDDSHKKKKMILLVFSAAKLQ